MLVERVLLLVERVAVLLVDLVELLVLVDLVELLELLLGVRATVVLVERVLLLGVRVVVALVERVVVVLGVRVVLPNVLRVVLRFASLATRAVPVVRVVLRISRALVMPLLRRLNERSG